MGEEKYVELANICNGAAAELFEKELERALANIADPNMPARSKRAVVLQVELEPDEERDRCRVLVSCQARLPKRTGAIGAIFTGKKDGRHVAVEYDPRQKGLFDSGDEAGELRAIQGGKHEEE